MPCSREAGALVTFLDRYRAGIVILNGRARGVEFPLSQQRVIFGRGPGVDLSLDAQGVAREHAVIEFWGDGFVLRDLDTDAGIRLNGQLVHTRQLADGDHFQLGELRFEYVVVERKLA